MIENEILYYTREQAPDEARRLHYLAHRRVGVDARRPAGVRARPRDRARQEAPARRRRGVDALLRLAPLRRAARAARAAARGVPARLQGRARAKPGARLRAARDRDRAPARSASQRDPVVHLITHAALHVPRPLVAGGARGKRTSSACSSCRAAASSISSTSTCSRATPSSTTRRCSRSSARAQAATKIVDQASKVSERVSVPPPSLAPPRSREDTIPPSLRAPRSVR